MAVNFFVSLKLCSTTSVTSIFMSFSDERGQLVPPRFSSCTYTGWESLNWHEPHKSSMWILSYRCPSGHPANNVKTLKERRSTDLNQRKLLPGLILSSSIMRLLRRDVVLFVPVLHCRCPVSINTNYGYSTKYYCKIAYVCKRSSGWIRYDNHIHITQPSAKYMYLIAMANFIRHMVTWRWRWARDQNTVIGHVFWSRAHRQRHVTICLITILRQRRN